MTGFPAILPVKAEPFRFDTLYESWIDHPSARVIVS